MNHSDPVSSSARCNLIRVAVVASCLVGLALGLTRFLVLLRHDLRGSITTWQELLLVIAITAFVAALILIASAAVGFLIGAALETVRSARRSGSAPISR